MVDIYLENSNALYLIRVEVEVEALRETGAVHVAAYLARLGVGAIISATSALS